MDVGKYLERIGAESAEPSPAALADLQRRHLLSVPFENLDIHLKRPIVPDVERFYTKIEESGRGGFCYELNGLFNELLIALGYTTRLISARVTDRKGGFGPEFDHAAVIVSFGADEYLADVGFGDFTAEPLRFVTDIVQHDARGTFVIRSRTDGYFEVAERKDSNWEPEYIFKDISRELDEFRDMCDFQQYSPESHFTKGRLCSIMTHSGRKTLTDSKFIVLHNRVRTEREIDIDAEFPRVLEDEFGIRALNDHAMQLRKKMDKT